MPLRLVLMGTGEFAIPPFRAILESDHVTTAVFTQPDRTGSGHHRHVNVVKELAIQHQIPVFQPDRINETESLDQLRQLQADVFVVASFGQILKQSLLDIPRLGAFNIHGSLLPRHRGAAPVQYAIWKGDRTTGVTIFQIERSLDSGPVAGKVSTEIGDDETSGELMMRLASLSAPLCLKVLQLLESGTVVLEKQDPELVTLSPRITKADGVINWKHTRRQIHCQIRAMQPWPKASTCLQRHGQATLRCILLKTAYTPFDNSSMSQQQSTRTISTETISTSSGPPGSVRVLQGRLFVNAADGIMEITQIQPEGRKPMDGLSFVNGYSVTDRDQFVDS